MCLTFIVYILFYILYFIFAHFTSTHWSLYFSFFFLFLFSSKPTKPSAAFDFHRGRQEAVPKGSDRAQALPEDHPSAQPRLKERPIQIHTGPQPPSRWHTSRKGSERQREMRERRVAWCIVFSFLFFSFLFFSFLSHSSRPPSRSCSKLSLSLFPPPKQNNYSRHPVCVCVWYHAFPPPLFPSIRSLHHSQSFDVRFYLLDERVAFECRQLLLLRIPPPRPMSRVPLLLHQPARRLVPRMQRYSYCVGIPPIDKKKKKQFEWLTNRETPSKSERERERENM